MAAPVRIEARAWGDLRFATLARVLGLADADHALIKVARLWSWQTEHFEPSRPTYLIDRDTIESVLGVGGPEALVRSKLATETPDGWRMHGTEGSIEWCQHITSKRARGGKARADTARRGDDGRLLGNIDYREPAHAGDAGPAPSSSEPAQSSSPTPDPTPTPEDLRSEIAFALQSPDSVASLPPTKRSRSRARKAAAHPMPPGWEPRPQENAKAMALGFSADLLREQFTDHHTARGSVFVDWDAAFRTWIGNARRFGNGTQNGRNAPAEQPIRKIRTL